MKFFKTLFRNFNNLFVSTTTIIIDGKQVDPKDPEVKKIMKEAQDTMDSAFKEMDKAFDSMDKVFDAMKKIF